MSTKTERNIHWKNFKANRPNWATQIRNHQGVKNLSNDVVAEAGDGWTNREGQDEPYPQNYVGDIRDAIAWVQKVAAQYPDSPFSQWAATSDQLKAAPSNTPRQAKVNRSGQTQDPLVYPANSESSNAGSRKTITSDELSNPNASQLAKLEAKAKQLLAGADKLLSSHITQVDKL